MNNYKTFNKALKALFHDMYYSSTGTGTFTCTIEGKPFKVDYQIGSQQGTFGLNVHLGDDHYLINNTHTQYDTEFQIYYKSFSLHYNSTTSKVQITDVNGETITISANSYKGNPYEDYLIICKTLKGHYTHKLLESL